MLKATGLGAIIFLVLAVVSIGTGSEWLIDYAGGVGVAGLVLAIILGNAIPSGLAQGSHMQGQETAEDRKRKNRWSTYLLLAALPNLLGAVLVYLYIHP